MDSVKFETFIIFQHSNGVGHVTRCSTLAQSLTSISSVTMFSGGPPIADYSPPPGVDFIQLPATRWDLAADARPVPVDAGYTLDEVDRVRSKILVDRYLRVKPQVIVIDYFPFGPQRFGKALNALLDILEKEPRRPITISSIRACPSAKLWDTEIPAKWVNRQLFEKFSGVFHHADPNLFPLPSLGSYVASALSGISVWQTGFIRRPFKKLDQIGPSNGLLLTVGGGSALGARLLKRWVKAAKAGSSGVFPVNVVCGAMMSARDRESVRAEQDVNVTVHDYVGVMDELIASSRAVVCLGGYNTLVEALSLSKPVLAFPNSELGDQALQVAGLYSKGMLLTGDQSFTDSEITAAMNRLLEFRPKHSIDCNGAARSVEVIKSLVAAS